MPQGIHVINFGGKTVVLGVYQIIPRLDMWRTYTNRA